MRIGASVGRLISAIAGAALGVMLTVLNGAAVLGMISKIIGVFLLVINIPRAVIGVAGLGHRIGRMEFVSSLVGAVIGCVMLFLPGAVLGVATAIAGVWFLVLPIFDIVAATYKAEQFKAELPKLVIGVGLILLGPSAVVGILFKLIGVVIFLVSIFSLVAELMLIAKRK
ncbi:MAG: hypothetical protein IKB34_02150 [Clostridia bacterium]|nr:hypothetical protein [Clostridia bacterium]